MCTRRKFDANKSLHRSDKGWGAVLLESLAALLPLRGIKQSVTRACHNRPDNTNLERVRRSSWSKIQSWNRSIFASVSTDSHKSADNTKLQESRLPEKTSRTRCSESVETQCNVGDDVVAIEEENVGVIIRILMFFMFPVAVLVSVRQVEHLIELPVCLQAYWNSFNNQTKKPN